MECEHFSKVPGTQTILKIHGGNQHKNKPQQVADHDSYGLRSSARHPNNSENC